MALLVTKNLYFLHPFARERLWGEFFAFLLKIKNKIKSKNTTLSWRIEDNNVSRILRAFFWDKKKDPIMNTFLGLFCLFWVGSKSFIMQFGSQIYSNTQHLVSLDFFSFSYNYPWVLGNFSLEKRLDSFPWALRTMIISLLFSDCRFICSLYWSLRSYYSYESFSSGRMIIVNRTHVKQSVLFPCQE